VNKKRNDRIFTALAFQVMDWQHGTCDHFVALSLHEDALSFDHKNTVGKKLAFLAKPEIRLELKLEH